MNHDLNKWLSEYIAALEASDCLRIKELVVRKPIDPKEIGREVAERMRYRMAGSPVWTDRCIPLEPR